MGNETS